MNKKKGKNLFSNSKRSSPYYSTQRKLIISKHIIDIEIINLILDYINDNLIIKGNIGELSRSLKISNMDLDIYLQLKKKIQNLLGFYISRRTSVHKYTMDEINSLGCFIPDMEIECTDGTRLQYKEFNLCDIPLSMEFIIKKIPQSKYDVICGLDIQLYLMRKLYGMKYKKISKTTRNKLISSGVKVFMG